MSKIILPNKINWQNLPKPTLGWANTIEKILRAEKIPEITGKNIYIVSDYSGQHKESKYEVFSILLVDWENSFEWLFNQKIMRKEILADGRRISFKNLHDKKKQNALIPFLRSAFTINGILLNVCINKSIETLCWDDEIFQRIKKNIPLQAGWNYKRFERMARITEFITILIAGVSKKHQNIYWITDTDEFTSNVKYLKDVQSYMGMIGGYYLKDHKGELGLGTTDIDPGDRIEEDLASIADLSAGTLSEILNVLNAKNGKISPNLLFPLEDKYLSFKTNLIYDWFQTQSDTLTKTSILFEKHSMSGYSVSKFGLA